MKYKILSLAFCVSISSAFAATKFETMFAVNKQIIYQQVPQNWHSDQVAIPADPIAYHLSEVESHLRNHIPSSIPFSLYKQRAKLLDILHAYHESRAFPENIHLSFRTPIFIDEFNHYCAVGWLMHNTGAESLARKIQATQNMAYLKNIQVEGLEQWVTKSGFTVDELAWIQPGYPPPASVTPLLGGVNGAVYAIEPSNFGTVYAAGAFDTAHSTPVNNVAEYLPGFAGYLWTNVGEGFNGTVFTLDKIENDLIAGGSFTASGSTPIFGVGRFVDGNWETLGSGLNGVVHDLEWFNGSLYAVGQFNKPETNTPFCNFARWNGTSWESFDGWINGPVYKLYNDGNRLLLGGSFSSVSGVTVSNIVAFDGIDFEAIGTGLTMPVRAIERFNNEILVGGNLFHNNQLCGIMHLENEAWNSMLNIMEFSLDSSNVIYDLDVINNRLLVSGNLQFFPMNGNFGSGVLELSIFDGNGYFNGYTSVDSTVYALEPYLDGIYAGGIFQYSGNTMLNGIGVIEDLITSIRPNQTSIQLKAIPNPSNGEILIQGIDEDSEIKIFSIDGRMVKHYYANQDHFIQPQPSGLYLLQLVQKGKQETLKIIFN
jgi:hypothetical protein